MKILINEILKTFDDNNINISKLNKHGFNEIHFWKFIKQHKDENKKGIYVFIDGDKEFPKNIIYVGKAGESKKNEKGNNLGSRMKSYFFPKKKNKLLDDQDQIIFRKFNSSKINPNKVNPLSKNFNIITVSTNNIDLVSPELLESYLLNKLYKENKYYPLANNEI
jgi:hypothetical protein